MNYDKHLLLISLFGVNEKSIVRAYENRRASRQSYSPRERTNERTREKDTEINFRTSPVSRAYGYACVPKCKVSLHRRQKYVDLELEGDEFFSRARLNDIHRYHLNGNCSADVCHPHGYEAIITMRCADERRIATRRDRVHSLRQCIAHAQQDHRPKRFSSAVQSNRSSNERLMTTRNRRDAHGHLSHAMDKLYVRVVGWQSSAHRRRSTTTPTCRSRPRDAAAAADRSDFFWPWFHRRVE